ncbi:MAG: ThaI family type II restriction endonuclease [Thermodesulfovibrionales bacterium]
MIERIQRKLPYLFQLAQIEVSRAGKTGMEVGTLREQIIIALLIYKFGEENVDTNISITKPEVDVKVFSDPVSIKTFTGKNLSGVKISWTVDAKSSKEFLMNYNPSCDILLVQINWDAEGFFTHIPEEVQIKHFKRLGRDNYIKLPKEGTNPRGIEFKKEALESLLYDDDTKKMLIKWTRQKIEYNPYKRWVEFWDED